MAHNGDSRPLEMILAGDGPRGASPIRQALEELPALYERQETEKWAARPVEILLVEDNPGDVRLVQEALNGCRGPHSLHVVADGVEALAFLKGNGGMSGCLRPDLVLLDLNLPRVDGREVLRAMRRDLKLRSIPVVVLTSSNAQSDVKRAYDLNANCYITKPDGLDQFLAALKSVFCFWSKVVTLPDL